MAIQYFAHYDTGSGDYKSYYTTDIWPDTGSIPTPNIELTKEEWVDARSNTRYRVISGIHTEVPFTTDEINAEELLGIRNTRSSLLEDSDWVVLPHSPITGSKLDEWIQYRQDLRYITSQTPPYTLPTKPE